MTRLKIALTAYTIAFVLASLESILFFFLAALPGSDGILDAFVRELSLDLWLQWFQTPLGFSITALTVVTLVVGGVVTIWPDRSG